MTFLLSALPVLLYLLCGAVYARAFERACTALPSMNQKHVECLAAFEKEGCSPPRARQVYHLMNVVFWPGLMLLAIAQSALNKGARP